MNDSEPVRTTPTRAYAIWAFVDLDGQKSETYLVFVAVWHETSHDRALRGWAADNPEKAKQYTGGFLVITDSSAKRLNVRAETTYVVS